MSLQADNLVGIDRIVAKIFTDRMNFSCRFTVQICDVIPKST